MKDNGLLADPALRGADVQALDLASDNSSTHSSVDARPLVHALTYPFARHVSCGLRVGLL